MAREFRVRRGMGSANSPSTGDGVSDVEGVVSPNVGVVFGGSIASTIILRSLEDTSLLLLSADKM